MHQCQGWNKDEKNKSCQSDAQIRTSSERL